GIQSIFSVFLYSSRITKSQGLHSAMFSIRLKDDGTRPELVPHLQHFIALGCELLRHPQVCGVGPWSDLGGRGSRISSSFSWQLGSRCSDGRFCCAAGDLPAAHFPLRNVLVGQRGRCRRGCSGEWLGAMEEVPRVPARHEFYPL